VSSNTASWLGPEVVSQVPATVVAHHRFVIAAPAGTQQRPYHRLLVTVFAENRAAPGSQVAPSSPYPDSG
jgi:hypothetical protein